LAGYKNHKIFHLTDSGLARTELDLINEEPLSIRVQGKPYTVVMRTPGDEIAHVAGFCLGEGIVDSPDDIETLAYCDDDINVVTATIKPERAAGISDVLMRRGFISQTSCGICGKELVEDLKQQVNPVHSSHTLSLATASASLDALGQNQALRDKTRASHGAAAYSAEGQLLSIGEDAGRHNALDKCIGSLFLEKILDQAAFIVLSSRISYELVQKTARAGIPVILAVSRPTVLAVDLANDLGMTLACLNKKSGLFIFCGEHRIV